MDRCRQNRTKLRFIPLTYDRELPRTGGEQEGSQDGEQDSKKQGGYVVGRAYTVFNAAHCVLPEAWAEKAQGAVPDMDPAHKIGACEEIVAEMPGRAAHSWAARAGSEEPTVL